MMNGVVESDEIYVSAGLKDRNNSRRIKHLGRKPRCRGLKRRGRGAWSEDKPQSSSWWKVDGGSMCPLVMSKLRVL